jgi:hypothetical protein
LELLTDLLKDQPESELLRYQIARTLRQDYRYADLNAFLVANPIVDPAAAERLAADLAFDYGDVVAGYEGTAARAAALKARGQFRVALENEIVALWRGALAGSVTVSHCDDMIAELDRHDTRLGIRTAFAAKAVCSLADPGALSAMIAASDQVMVGGRGYQGWREWTPTVLHGLRHDRPDLVTQVRAEWLNRHRQTGPNYRILDRLLIFAGHDPVLPEPQLGTSEEQIRVDARWMAVFQDILSR